MFQAACDLLFVDFPVTKRTVVGITFSEPSIIHDQHLNATFFCLSGNVKKLVRIKIKICSLPVVDQDRTFLIFKFAADEMVPVKVMITSCHRSKTVSGVNYNHLRCLEFLSRCKEPGKFLRIDSHSHTEVIKLAQLCLRHKVSGIHEMHGVNFTVFLLGSVCHKGNKRMFLVAGLSSRGRDHLFSVMELSCLDVTLSCPGSVKRQHGKILIVHIQADT